MQFKQFLTEQAAQSAKIAFNFAMAIPITSQFHVGLSSGKSFEETIALAAESLAVTLDVSVKYRKAQAARPSSWVIEPSASADNTGAHPIEIVSPFMSAELALRNLNHVYKWMSENEMRTSDDDRLRVSFEVKALNDKLDPVKLVMHLDAPSTEAVFNKTASKFTAAQIEILIQKMKQTGKLPLQATNLHQAALSYLGKRPDGNTNFGNVPDDSIEFTVATGAGYQQDAEYARKKISRLAKAINAATDPNYMKSEYIKSVAALFSADSLPMAKDGQEDKLPEDLRSLYNFDPEILNAFKLYHHDAEFGHARPALLVLINRCIAAALKRKASLTSKEKALLKTYARQSALLSADLDGFYGYDKLTRLKVKKDLAL